MSVSFNRTGRPVAWALRVLLLITPSLALADAPYDLSGLWHAKRIFDPDAQGPLRARHANDEWTAEIAGQTVTGHDDERGVRFNFGSERGTFILEADEAVAALDGWWWQPRNSFNAHGFATPVRLIRTADDVWSGNIEPLRDEMTFFMPLQRSGKPGNYSTFIRNPERNIGIFMKATRLTVDGTTVRLLGRPRNAEREVTVATGAYEPESDVITLYLPEYGGSYDFKRVAPGEASDFYPRGFPTARYEYRIPRQLDDGWPVAELESIDLSRTELERFVQMIIDMPMAGLGTSDIHSVLIARHGKLVLEEYFHGFHRDRLHDLRSAGKSLTSSLVGAAIHREPDRLEVKTPVYRDDMHARFGADSDLGKRAMTLEHLLTMSAGYFCDDANPDAPGNEDVLQEQTAEPDWYAYTLALPMVTAPGEKSVYCSCQSNLIGGIVRREMVEPLATLFRDLIAEPLGIRRYAMNLQPLGEPYMGGGIYLAPRDFLKFGQMMLDRGTWNGRRIVSESWSQSATTPRVRIGKRGYGYQWWVDEFPRPGRTPLRTFLAGGNGGQIVMVVPEYDLVIGFNGGNYNDRVLYVPQNEWVPNIIVSAITTQ